MQRLKDKHLAVFDLDRTLVWQNSSFAFSLYLYKTGVLSIKDMALAFFYRWRFSRGKLSLKELHEKIFRAVLQGLSLSVLEESALRFLDGFLPAALYPPAFAALRFAQHTGCYTAILSSSPDFLVLPIARKWGVPHAAATVYQVDKDRRLCNIAELMEGTTKAHFLEELQKELSIGKDATSVYTDSYDDLPLLTRASQLIAVNPDPKLQALAEKRQWCVL